MFGLFNSSDGKAEDGNETKPCNVSGHEWTEWEDDPFSAKASSYGSGRHELHVYQGQSRTCRKCGKYDTRRKTLGYIDKREDDISVVNE